MGTAGWCLTRPQSPPNQQRSWFGKSGYRPSLRRVLGLAVKLVTALPPKTPPEASMEELDDQYPSAFDLFMARVLHHKQRLTEGADPLDVDIATVAELRKFLNVAGVRLPSDVFLQALSDVHGGGDPPYFKARRRPRPPLLRHQQLMGLVTFLVETLTAGKAFKKWKAAEEVTQGNRIWNWLDFGPRLPGSAAVESTPRYGDHTEGGCLWKNLPRAGKAWRIHEPAMPRCMSSTSC